MILNSDRCAHMETRATTPCERLASFGHVRNLILDKTVDYTISNIYIEQCFICTMLCVTKVQNKQNILASSSL